MSWQHVQQTARIDAHCWASGAASVCLKKPIISSKKGNAVIALNRYSLDRLNGYLPDDSSLIGEITAESTLQWNVDSATQLLGSLDLQAEQVGVETISPTGKPIQFVYDDISLDVALQPRTAKAELKLTSTQLGNARIALNLDTRTENYPISGQVELDSLDIRIAHAFIPQLSRISGVLEARGELSGQLAKPFFDGDIILNEPIVEGELLPAGINGGQLLIRVAGSRANYDGELISGDGRVSLQGFTSWETDNADTTENGLRTVLEIKGDNLTLVREPVVDSSIYPTLRITATPTLLSVEGEIAVPSARIEFRDLPASATTLSKDIIVIEDEAEAILREQAALDAIDIQVRTRVNLGDEVTLNAFGLDAELTGDFVVTIDGPKPPQLLGKVQVVKGQYKQYGQNLNVTDGEILFVGPIDQARLDIDAVREIDGEERIAGLHLEGPIATPVVTLFTEPADKDDESILSYIVIGRDITEASDQDSDILAAAALALTLKGSRGTATDVADKLGIEEFELASRGSGDDTEVVVSGRVNNRLLVRYGQNIFTGQNSLYLRYDLTKQLYLEAAQSTVENAVDFFYSFSF